MSRQILLLVTGDLEKKALAASLQQAFPQDEQGEPVQFMVQKVRAMTSNRLPAQAPAGVRASLLRTSPVAEMARALIASATEKRSSRELLPDLVVGVDDLELANLDQPSIVTGLLREALATALEERVPSLSARQRMEEAVRERCSFHFLVPMVEAYFFGDPAAIKAAGVSVSEPPLLAELDVERFETNDPQFLPLAQDANSKKHAAGIGYWREECHPKRYLEHLTVRSGGQYEETVGGVKALSALAWPRVPATPQAAAFLRSLFEDVATLLGVPNPLGAGVTSPATWPGKSVRRGSLVLRNL